MPERMQDWVDALDVTELPVLEHTVEELGALHARESRITTQHVANVVLHDPLMTVKVLYFLQQHRGKRQSREITTIAHALMMLGLTPFFAHFSAPATITGRLARERQALHGVLSVAGRARQAALYARDWARIRHDIDPEEIMIAALLHDLAEMLVWCFAPALALEVQRCQRERGSRSESAQLSVLGFRLIDLQLALVKAWNLPQLLHTLLDQGHADNPRVQNVALAAALARHASYGWNDAALPDDYFALARLLRMPYQAVKHRVGEIALEGGREAAWYGAAAAPAPTGS